MYSGSLCVHRQRKSEDNLIELNFPIQFFLPLLVFGPKNSFPPPSSFVFEKTKEEEEEKIFKIMCWRISFPPIFFKTFIFREHFLVLFLLEKKKEKILKTSASSSSSSSSLFWKASVRVESVFERLSSSRVRMQMQRRRALSSTRFCDE